jgi:DNA-directed RNA polymerase specialized sigma24 family protein
MIRSGSDQRRLDKMERQREVNLDEMAVRLLGVIAVKGLPQTQQIAILSRVGFTPKEIADVLGTTANTVRVALVGIRKAEKQGKRTGLLREEGKDE